MIRSYISAAFAVLISVASANAETDDVDKSPAPAPARAVAKPTPGTLVRSASVNIDLRALSNAPPPVIERPEWEDPDVTWVELPGAPPPHITAKRSIVTRALAAAPSPTANFAGLDFANWGAGHPPDTNGDAGPVYYIQTINSSVGVFRKSDGARIAAFSFNTLMSQGNFGNLCDTNNFGDPVTLYDSFEDRWILTDFAFTLTAGAVDNPPGSFQCFAVSKTGDPVSGGWNFYSMQLTDGLNDYPKFGIWADGLYMSANMFGFAAGGAFQGPRVWALNKAQMYAGAPSVQIVSFDAPSSDFTLLPSNARLQAGAPPAGTPNYFVSTWQFLNALTVYKFHVDWARTSLSTFTGPDAPLASTSWPNANVANAPEPAPGNALDVLQIRAMAQNQYSNIGGVESLWTTHTVRRANTTGFAAPRWYQVNVTGGTVAANLPQATTWDPDGANVLHRFMPSLAVNRLGDLALGYSTSSTTAKPAIKYAGRLAGDPINTFSQTEQLLTQGTGVQTGSCGSGSCIRWGDYSSMTLDPDGCTFWYTNMYYAVDGLNYQTQIGSFKYPGCVPVGGGGTVSGTVTALTGGAPIAGATVTLGSRTATTNGSGFYSFTAIPAGTYSGMTGSSPWYSTASASGIVLTDGATTTQNFALATAAAGACLTDTSLADFQLGVANQVDLTTSPGNVTLSNAPSLDAQNTAGTTTGTGFNTSSWGGETFIPGLSGQLVRADVQLFCSGCTGTTPNLTLSVRATSGGLPTGGDLATATIAGFSNGAGIYYTGTFSTPATLTAGTQYALILRPTANPSVGGYFWIRSSPSTYANGQRVISTDNGATFTADSTRDFNFKTYIQTGFAASGDLVSGLKDANPAVGYLPSWTTLSWTAATPANAALKFQIAASNSSTGPFNFVGPDGTAATFFTLSGASLAQFNGLRYLKYKSYLSTADSAVSPTVNDVTMCFADLGPPDLALTVSDGGASVAPGATVAYMLAYSHVGGQGATGVVLTETVPANSTLNVSASSAGWACSPGNSAGSTCTLSVGAVAVGGSGSATFAVTANSSLPAGVTQLSNTASIADDGTHGVDPAPGNNTASDTTPILNADLSITVVDGVATATPGGSVTYTITASNAGANGATGATVADTFPASLTCTWTCVGASGGSCTAAGSGSINDTVNLPLGGSVTYTASCTVSVSATGTLSNTATVAAPAGVTDPTPGNNSATDSDTFLPPADLAITKTHAGNFAQGQTGATYTLTARNAGGSPTSGTVTVTDTLPAGLTATAISGPGWSCTLGALTCMRSDALAAGSSYPDITLTVNVANNAAASVTNIAVVSGGGETNTSNDTASDVTTIATTTYTIGGSVAGATSPAALTLSASTHGTSQSLSSSGAFTFPTPLPIGSNWNVAVTTPPSGQTCVVANGTGTNLSANVTNVQVTCATVVVTITPAALSSGTFSLPYSQPLIASSSDSVNHAPYAFTLTSGSLPPGLTLGAASGLLSGAPAGVGSFSFTVQAAGSGGVSGTQAYTLIVNKKTTTVTLAATPNPTNPGVPVSLVATVAGDPPTGTVSFSDNGITLPCSPVTLVVGTTSSTAVCTTAFTMPGAHPITASYSGDAGFVEAASSVLAVTINAPSVPAPILGRWAMLILCGLIGTVVFVRLRRS